MYTTDVTRVVAHWGGFSDPNSGIMYYRFCIGSQPEDNDVWGWEDTGLHTGKGWEDKNQLQIIQNKILLSCVIG